MDAVINIRFLHSTILSRFYFFRNFGENTKNTFNTKNAVINIRFLHSIIRSCLVFIFFGIISEKIRRTFNNTKNSKCAFQKYLNIFKKCGETNKFHNIFNRLGTPFSTKLPYCCQRRYRVGNRTNRTCYLV